MRPPRPWKAFFPLLAVITSVVSPCPGEVTVDQKPVVIERKTFDPAHRPAEMPPLKAGEAAVTESRFDCSADLSYRVTDRNPTAAGCTTTLRVESVHLTLTLKILIWLPTSAPPKLVAHEDGHSRIDQRIYEEAKTLAESEGKSTDGQLISASAADCTAAENKATQSAADEICKRYLQAVGQRTQRVNQHYDSITSHGTKLAPAEDKAIQQAFDHEHRPS
jgi:hypothetical protein